MVHGQTALRALRTFCITLPETPERKTQALSHFLEVGLHAEFLNGIYAKGFGLKTEHTYDFDHPGTGYVMDQKHVGLHLSHYMAWQGMQMCLGENSWLLIEDDAKFPDDWEDRLNAAMWYCPPDTDLLFVGSCNTFDKPKTDQGNGIWAVEWPQCTHAYVVFRKALPILLSTQRDCFAPIDLSLIHRSFPFLKVYTVLPRIVSQRGTAICD